MKEEQVLYVIEDPQRPPPPALAQYTHEEIEFNEKYLKEKGFPWRHYYGPDGPRPPPVLFMWPAKSVGEVHSITTSNGYW